MSHTKKALVVLCLIFFAIQLIQPAHNKGGQVSSSDFAVLYDVPKPVEYILQNACYDCHSNNTQYPWYSNIQPLAWMMERHIKNGKEKLNFNDFGKNTTRKQISKLKGASNQIKDNAMPIISYSMMHEKANLTHEEKQVVIKWMEQLADSLSVNH